MLCDLAQYYNIYDYRTFPPIYIAALVNGLPEDSRVYRGINNIQISDTVALLAAAVDRLSILIWQQTKDGAKNRHRPPSILEDMYNRLSGDESIDVISFDTGEEFEKARKEMIERMSGA